MRSLGQTGVHHERVALPRGSRSMQPTYCGQICLHEARSKRVLVGVAKRELHAIEGTVGRRTRRGVCYRAVLDEAAHGHWIANAEAPTLVAPNVWRILRRWPGRRVERGGLCKQSHCTPSGTSFVKLAARKRVPMLVRH